MGMAKSLAPGRSADWKLGYQAGCRHTRDAVWTSVIKYVNEHDRAKANDLKIAIIDALTKKSERERESES
jgi:hypothetical protein